MFRTAAIFISVVGFVVPAIAQDKEQRLPQNTIDCKQFKKSGPQEWIEVGTAVFDLGGIRDINLTGQPVTPRYFKFGGFDLYTVVEQKCGASAYFYRGNAAQAKGDFHKAIVDYNEALRLDPRSESATIQRVIALGRLTKLPALNSATDEPEKLGLNAIAPKTELAQDKSAQAPTQAAAPAPTQTPAPATPAQTATPAQIREAVSALEGKHLKNSTDVPCRRDGKSIYIADALPEGKGGGSRIEIVLNNNENDSERSGPNSEFLIREYKNNELEWAYRGKHAQERFIFTPLSARQPRFLGRPIFTPVHLSRPRPVILATSYIKPNRDGTGEAILYVSGLRALFASKENASRFKFEGKRPSEPLPEAFYFNRCE